jgi:hypothetical protein
MSKQNEGNKWEQIVEEEAPHMRSVAMVSHSPTTATAFHQQHNRQQYCFGLKPGGIVGPDQQQKSKPIPTESDFVLAPIKSWNVTKLMSIPPYYRLERYHVSISSAISLKVVLDRLMDIFHSESIAAVYDDDEVRQKENRKGYYPLHIACKYPLHLACRYPLHLACKYPLHLACIYN